MESEGRRNCLALLSRSRLLKTPYVPSSGLHHQLSAVPNHSRQGYTPCQGALGVHGRGAGDLLYQSLLCAGMVHCYLCPGHLPPESLPGLFATQDRPLSRDGLGSGLG